jgi:hypothetical protein
MDIIFLVYINYLQLEFDCFSDRSIEAMVIIKRSEDSEDKKVWKNSKEIGRKT